LALLPIISHSGLETAVVMWGEFEQVHNRAYTWIEENVYPNGDIIKNTILDNDLLKLCASKVSVYYNNLIKFNNMRDLYLDHGITEFKRNDGTIEMYSEYEHKRHTLRCLFAINGLEAIRFQVSFACNFAFMKRGLMVGTGGQLSLIARDENLHIQLSQAIIKYIISNDKDFAQLFVEEREILASIYKDIASEEKLWVKYIFSKGSIYGLSESILNQWLDYLLYLRLRSHGFDHVKCENPIPWYYGMISQEKQQQALMEYESSNYKKGVLHMTVDTQRFSKFKNKM
jgi:ribonucleoside-diphosphate reductase beta chain